MVITDEKVCLLTFLFIIDGIMMFVFERFPQYFFPAYRSFSRTLMKILSQFTGFVPFSLWDLIAALLLMIFIISLIYTIIKKKKILKLLNNTLLTVSLLAFIAVNGWMLNHYGPSLAEELNMEVRQYSKEELLSATDYYLRQAARYSINISRDGSSHALPYDFNELAIKSGSAYQTLADQYPLFDGSTVRVKRFSLIGEYLMYNGIIGMFMPITAEASIPYNVPPIPMPFTMTHEAAHRLALAGEDEANFAAFLACINSKEDSFLYSGYYSAFSYCFSSLYKIDPEAAVELYHRYDSDPGIILLKTDRRDTAEIYKKYESPLQDISDQINDTYLKTFSEESGIQSYGEVTDYLIAYYLNLSAK